MDITVIMNHPDNITKKNCDHRWIFTGQGTSGGEGYCKKCGLKWESIKKYVKKP